MPFTPTDIAAVAKNARAAHAVIEHAANVGLPMPHTVTVHEGDEPTSFQFDSLVELTEWSRWTEQPITEHEGQAGAIHHYVHATELDHAIKCVAITWPGAK
jgi:hypothetical protein